MITSTIQPVKLFDNTDALYLRATIEGKVENPEFDTGALFLFNNGRSYILDAVRTEMNYIDGNTVLRIELTRDDDTFADNPYDLTEEDLFFGCEATFYLTHDGEPAKDMQLILSHGLLTVSLEVKQEI